LSSFTCTISGSFRRFLPQIKEKIEECLREGITVLSPRSGNAVGELPGFILVEGDRGEPKEIESDHLQCIRRSDFLYVVNPGGYIGPSATMEIGYALAAGVTVFSSELPTEPVLAMFVRRERSIGKVKRMLGEAQGLEIPCKADLATLQAYIRKVVHIRGFDEESLRDVVLLLVEEVGELAKAVRWQVGLKVARSHPEDNKTVALELADCLIYLLDIANLAGIDLDDAFRAKEKINQSKSWTKDTCVSDQTPETGFAVRNSNRVSSRRQAERGSGGKGRKWPR
jgi:NTP pyrophosphatase (non-canonical NTP hydrolase)